MRVIVDVIQIGFLLWVGPRPNLLIMIKGAGERRQCAGDQDAIRLRNLSGQGKLIIYLVTPEGSDYSENSMKDALGWYGYDRGATSGSETSSDSELPRKRYSPLRTSDVLTSNTSCSIEAAVRISGPPRVAESVERGVGGWEEDEMGEGSGVELLGVADLLLSRPEFSARLKGSQGGQTAADISNWCRYLELIIKVVNEDPECSEKCVLGQAWYQGRITSQELTA
ncbi:unnamed protein product [Nezara viridula]|uniref:Uncharacterized protein n=1 Tax=Nezara viridula TaxID=85310 RepID=A0A9P0E520_NEZVI|nr:unnamed protein product [Nezara viridula]